MAALVQDLQPLSHQPVKGSGATVDDQVALVAHRPDPAIGQRIVDQRAMGLREYFHLPDHDHTAAGGRVLAKEPPREFRLAQREDRDRQPHHQQVDRIDVHQVQGTPHQRQVLGTQGETVVEVVRGHYLLGEPGVGPHLVGNAIGFDDRGVALAAECRRELAIGGHGRDRREYLALNPLGDAHRHFRILVTDVDSSRTIGSTGGS